MKAALTAALALLLCACAHTKVDTKPVSWRGGTIEPGDERAKVLQLAGVPPDRTMPMVSDSGVPLGEQWMFISRDPRDRHLLWVELTRGRVTRVWKEPMAGADR